MQYHGPGSFHASLRGLPLRVVPPSVDCLQKECRDIPIAQWHLDPHSLNPSLARTVMKIT